jgi:pimeloyl-ACP methyl ester carboxylesterase
MRARERHDYYRGPVRTAVQGGTRCKTEHFTYWDTAIMNLLVLDALGIEKAFALGTSQGGWLVVRMALLAPDRVGFISYPDRLLLTMDR